jgi:hypothetical protein
VTHEYSLTPAGVSSGTIAPLMAETETCRPSAGPRERLSTPGDGMVGHGQGRVETVSALQSSPLQETAMDFRIIGLNFLYAVLGLVLMYLSFVGFDYAMKKINFEDELQKGNIAVAIFTGSIFIAIAIIIGGALN